MNLRLLFLAVFVLLVASFVIFNRAVRLSPTINFEDIRRACCAECLNAFSQSPVGVGPSAARCGEFTSAALISEQCHNYYQRNPWTAEQCRELA